MAKWLGGQWIARFKRLFQPRIQPKPACGDLDQSVPHPLNAPGDFYVLNHSCISCEAPEIEAPNLMAHVSDANCSYHCYFRRQPTTPAEIEEAISAVSVCCCGALRYGGTDTIILHRLAEAGSAKACDHPLPSDDFDLPPMAR